MSLIRDHYYYSREASKKPGVMPSAWCDHNYPIEVHVYDGGRRARCLRCRAVGPICGDADIARRALLEHIGKIERSYETFLELPPPVVLVLLWLAGVVLLSICAAALYSYWLLLQAAA